MKAYIQHKDKMNQKLILQALVPFVCLKDSVFKPFKCDFPVHFLKAFIINIQIKTVFCIYNCCKLCSEPASFLIRKPTNRRNRKLQAHFCIHFIYVLPAVSSTSGKGHLRIIYDGFMQFLSIHFSEIIA